MIQVLSLSNNNNSTADAGTPPRGGNGNESDSAAWIISTANNRSADRSRTTCPPRRSNNNCRRNRERPPSQRWCAPRTPKPNPWPGGSSSGLPGSRAEVIRCHQLKSFCGQAKSYRPIARCSAAWRRTAHSPSWSKTMPRRRTRTARFVFTSSRATSVLESGSFATARRSGPCCFSATEKSGVGHTQRPPDPLAQKRAKVCRKPPRSTGPTRRSIGLYSHFVPA